MVKIKETKSKLLYLNNEKHLYKYIKSHLDHNGYLATTDKQLSQKLGVSAITVFRWRNRLKQLGLINCSVQFINGRKMALLSLKNDIER